MSRSRQALAMMLAWVGALVLLAVSWVWSPFTGTGLMFIVWSVPVAGLTVGTLVWLDRVGVRHVPRGMAVRGAVVMFWLTAAWLATSGMGLEMALDGLILRDPTLRASGVVLEWLPGGFGFLLSLVGLVATLEARYRVVRGDVKTAGEGSTG